MLGGNILYNAYVKDKHSGRSVQRMAPPVSDRLLGLDLLRTCRQIYSETALLAYSRNCYHFRHVSCFRSDIKRLKPFQRALISSIQLHAFISEGLLGSPEEHQTGEKAARDHL